MYVHTYMYTMLYLEYSGTSLAERLHLCTHALSLSLSLSFSVLPFSFSTPSRPARFISRNLNHFVDSFILKIEVISLTVWVEFLLKTDIGYPRDAGVFFHFISRKLRHFVEHGAEVVSHRDLLALVNLFIQVQKLIRQQLHPFECVCVRESFEYLCVPESHLRIFVCQKVIWFLRVSEGQSESEIKKADNATWCASVWLPSPYTHIHTHTLPAPNSFWLYACMSNTKPAETYVQGHIQTYVNIQTNTYMYTKQLNPTNPQPFDHTSW